MSQTLKEEIDIILGGNIPTQGPKTIKIIDSIKSSGDKLANSAGTFSKTLGKLGDSASDAGKDALGPLGKFVDVLPSGFGAAAIGIGVGVAAIVGATVATKALIDSMQPLKNAEKVFELKSATNGLATLTAIRKLGSDAGYGLDATTESATRLGAAFNNVEQAKKAFTTIADIKALVPTVGLDKLTDDFVELRAKTSVGTADMEKFAKEIGTVAPTFEQLAKTSGLTLDETKQQIKDGTFSAETYALSLEDAAKAAAGTQKAGEAALKLNANDPQAQINRVFDSFTTLKEAFAKGLLGGEGGAALSDLANSIKSLASNPQAIAFAKSLGTALSLMASVAIKLEGIWLSLIGNALAPLAPAFSAISDALGGTSGIMNGMISVTQALLTVAIFPLKAAIWLIANGFNLATDAIAATIGAFVSIGTAGATLVTDMFTLGTNIVQGLVNGISSLASAPVDALKNIGLNAIAGVKSILGIASPSKAFASIGEFTTEGFVQGVDNTASDAAQATTSLATGAIQGAKTGFTSPQINAPSLNGGNTPSQIVINFGDINGGSGSPADMSQAITDALIKALAQSGLTGQV